MVEVVEGPEKGGEVSDLYLDIGTQLVQKRP